MDRDFLIQLTNNLYRLTLLFPKKEPLRYKMREVADCILVKPGEEDLKAIDGFFEVALAQNWVSPSDILAIQKEYAILREELEKLQPLAIRKKEKANCVEDSLIEVQPQLNLAQRVSERQEKILAFLRENGRVQVWQVKQIFSEVTKRTLRRDFEHMLNQGVIERIGESNNTFYQIKTIQS